MSAELFAAQCLAMRARRLSRELTRLYEHEMKGLGITAARFNVLVAIATNPGVRAHQLVGPLAIEKSTLSRNLRGMIADGVVELRDGAHLYVTDEGAELLARARPAWDRAQEQARARLGPLADALLESDRS